MTISLKGVNKHVYNLYNALDYLYDVAIISSARAARTEDELDALKAKADCLNLAVVLLRIERAIVQYAKAYGIEAVKDKTSWGGRTFRLSMEASRFLSSCNKRYVNAFVMFQNARKEG